MSEKIKNVKFAFVRYALYLTEKTRVHIQNGNGKVGKGIYTVNLLPGDKPLTKKNGEQLTNICGSCAGCCECCKGDCYAMRYTIQHHNTVIPSASENTLLAMQEPDRFWNGVQDFLKYNIVSVVRFHASGEMPNYDYLLRMVKFAENNPTVTVYTYTKRYNFINRFFADGNKLPNNLIINASIWHKNYTNPYNLPEFIYDDGKEPDLANVYHCPAVDCNGHETGVTCAACRRCFTVKPGEKTAVYAH